MGTFKNSALIIFLVAITAVSAQAKRINVFLGRSTLVNAVNTARSGDSIIVYGGYYREHVYINKSLTLIGIKRPTIDGLFRGSVVVVDANNVSIQGFRIINSGQSSLHDFCGILVKQGNRIAINNNVFRSNQFSIMLQNCSHSRIMGNDVESNIRQMQVMGNAIHCWKSDHLLIKKNRVGHNRDGIYLEFVYSSLITGNRVSGCERYGLHFMFSHHNSYTFNHFSKNLAGVAVMYTHDVNMSGNVFDKNKGDSSYGLLLKEIERGTINNNTFADNTVGIYMDGGTMLHIIKNRFVKNGWGMRIVASSTNDSICSNDFVGNTFDISTNSSFNSNVFNGNYWDKYTGYDLNKNGFGDVPYHPLSLFSTLAEQNNNVMMFFRSFIMNLLDAAEKILPTLTPDNYVDNNPKIHRNLS